MVRLDELVAGTGGMVDLLGAADEREVAGITCDSREAVPGSLFVAVRGFNTDGHLHIEPAIRAGAIAVACEVMPSITHPSVCYLLVLDARKAMADLSKRFYGNAADQLMIIGVTGTNGKTTTSWLVTSMLNAAGIPAGYIGTGLSLIGDRQIEIERTTPEAPGLHALFRQMADAGCRAVVMEVSSHALMLDRVYGLRFRAAVFTNLTPEHLDFHRSMESYAEAKKRLFGRLDDEGFAVLNADDSYAGYMAGDLPADRLFCCSAGSSDSLFCDPRRRFVARVLSMSVEGSVAEVSFNSRTMRLEVPLPGVYNVMNMLEALATGLGLGIEPDSALQALAGAGAVDGRMERLWSPDRSRCAVVDYAHTPDALQKALETLRAVTPSGSRLVVVFGCGGNRDRLKRPVMGRIATDLADRVILTSDNPRNEPPEAILDEIEAGMEGRAHLRIPDRAEAIRRAVGELDHGDILLVAGKGHERYQEVQGMKHWFSDREELMASFQRAWPETKVKE
jgi:UDP-N-acetylmuramoyl-L-alanyl-D-glutamate--2,6-diaminopimelate ligase/murE/murF fusion protein